MNRSDFIDKVCKLIRSREQWLPEEATPTTYLKFLWMRIQEHEQIISKELDNGAE